MSSQSDNTPGASVGSVLDGCLALLASLKTQSERDSVVTALLSIAPPSGLKKLSARLPGTGSTTTHSAPPAAPAATKSVTSKKAKGAKKQEPPKPLAWAKDPTFVGLKKTQKDAAAALVRAKAIRKGEDLPDDDQLVIDFNSARTAVKNFRP